MAKGVFLVKAVRPRKRIDAEAWKLDILKALDREAQIIKRMYEKTVQTWSSPKPVFRITAGVATRPIREGGGAYVQVYTSDQRYLWVDLGTEGPYIIRARRAPYLRFKVGGKPKTKVRTIGSGAGSPGTQWVTKQEVTHPGIEAREFSDEIRKRRRPYFLKNMRREIEKAQRRHAW